MTLPAPKIKKESKDVHSRGREQGHQMLLQSDHISDDIALSSNKPEMSMVAAPITPPLQMNPAPPPIDLQMKCEECEKEDETNLSIQPKLEIGDPNDQYEKEAESVADKVMMFPNPAIDNFPIVPSPRGLADKVSPPSITNTLQTKYEEFPEEEEKLQMKLKNSSIIAGALPEDEEEEGAFSIPLIQRKIKSLDIQRNSTQSGNASGTNVENKLNEGNSPGYSIPDNHRNLMESRFGVGFDNIKIHTDTNSVQMNQDLNAQAFTYGNNIYFNQGKYDPNSSDGLHLLAHELTHTVQQGNGVSTKKIQRKKKKKNPPLSSYFFKGHPTFTEINKGTFLLRKETAAKVTKALKSTPDQQEEYLRRLELVVTTLQNALAFLGFDEVGTDDIGIFGEGTETALKNFQIEAGLTGRLIDGILGPITMRLLDAEFSVGPAKHYTESTEANAFFVEVPVTEEMEGWKKEKFFIYAVAHGLRWSKEDAKALQDAGWTIYNYSGITPDHVAQGYIPVAFNMEDVERIKGKEKPPSREGESQEEIESDLQSIMERLYGLESLYEKYKEDDDDPEFLKALEEKGFSSVEEFEEVIEDFTKKFGLYSVGQVYKILDKSRVHIGVAHERYKDDAGVKNLHDKLQELVPSYNESDDLFLKAIEVLFEKIVGANVKDEVSRKIAEQGLVNLLAVSKETLKLLTLKDRNELFDDIKQVYVWYILFSALEDPSIILDEEKFYAAFPEVKYLVDAIAKETEIEEKFVADNVDSYRIVADPQIRVNLRLYTFTEDTADLATDIRSTVANRLESIEKMNEHFEDTDNYEDVWELPPVLVAAKAGLNIDANSIFDLIIKGKVEDVASTKFWTSIGLAALGIGLAIGAIFTGGATAAALVALGAGVSGVDFYREFQDYQFKKHAYGTHFDKSRSLSAEEASVLWVVLAAVGLGLDFLSALKALKGLKLAKGAKNIDEVAGGMAKALKEGGALDDAAAATFEASVKKIGKLTIEGLDASILAKITEAVVNNPKLADDLIELDKLLKLGDVLEPAEVAGVFRFFGSIGNDVIENIPDLLKVIKEGAITDPKLIKEIFSQKSVIQVVLDNPDPAFIKRVWEDFTKVRPPSKQLKSKTFLEYLKNLHLVKSIKKTTKLTSLGADFAQWTNKVKNLEVLKTTERRLVEEIRKALKKPETSMFSENLIQKINKLLDEDLIGAADSVEKARGKIVSKLNKILGEGGFDWTETKKILEIINQPGSGGSIFEHWVRNTIKNLGDTFLRLKDGTRVLIDAHVIRKGKAIFMEMKHYPSGNRLSGHALEQLENYREILETGIKFSSKKLPIRFEYIFSTKVAAKRNLSLIKDYLGDNVDVFYITATGRRYKLK